MNLETRAQHAADAMLSSTDGIAAMEPLTELKRAATNRRRASVAVQALAVVVVLAGVAWLSLPGVGSAHRPPATGPSHSLPAPTYPDPPTRPPTLGSNLKIPFSAVAPSGYTVSCDCGFLWLADNATPPDVLFVGGPVDRVFDARTEKWIAAPHDYAAWLRTNPWLTVLDESTVLVDGREYPELTVKVRDDAHLSNGSPYQLPFAHLPGVPGSQPYTDFDAGDVFTEVALQADGRTVVVEATSSFGRMPQSVKRALAEFLASVRL